MIPHFDIPFKINGVRGALVVEQDSEDEIMNCLETILRYQKGQRPEQPEFGVPDVVFSEPTVDVTRIQEALIEWEPRVEAKVNQPIVTDLIHTIVVGASFERV